MKRRRRRRAHQAAPPDRRAEMRLSPERSFPKTERVMTIRCMVAAFAIAVLSIALIYGLV